jgi:hypothetical protein
VSHPDPVQLYSTLHMADKQARSYMSAHNCRCVITLGVDPSQALLRLFHCRSAELQDDVLLDVRKQYDCVVSQQVVDLTHGQNGPLLPCL